MYGIKPSIEREFPDRGISSWQPADLPAACPLDNASYGRVRPQSIPVQPDRRLIAFLEYISPSLEGLKMPVL
jgi:hypothetical protein